MTLEELKELKASSDLDKLEMAKEHNAAHMSIEDIDKWIDEAIKVEEERNDAG